MGVNVFDGVSVQISESAATRFRRDIEGHLTPERHRAVVDQLRGLTPQTLLRKSSEVTLTGSDERVWRFENNFLVLDFVISDGSPLVTDLRVA